MNSTAYFKGKPLKYVLNIKKSSAPQTPERGVAPAPDQGPIGPWTPLQDFHFKNVTPMGITIEQM